MASTRSAFVTESSLSHALIAPANPWATNWAMTSWLASRQIGVGAPSDEGHGVVGEVAHERLVHSAVSWVVDGVPVDGHETFDVIGDVDDRKAQHFRGRAITFGPAFVLEVVDALQVGQQVPG